MKALGIGLRALGLAACAHAGPPAPTDSSKVELAKVQARRLSTACQQFAKDKGATPENLNALTPTYLEVVPKDSWGNDFLFTGASCEVRSKGPDGIEGTSDDVTSSGQPPTEYTK